MIADLLQAAGAWIGAGVLLAAAWAALGHHAKTRRNQTTPKEGKK